MATGRSDILIRDYNNIRKILRDVYIFGCYSKEDFKKEGISPRKYDNEQMRIRSYLAEGFIHRKTVNRKAIMYCTYHMEDGSRNYMAETYRNKTFTVLDIMSYFFVLQLLSDGQEISLGELLDKIPENNEDNIFTKDNLRQKMEELVSAKLVNVVKEGHNVKYALADDIWSKISDSELQNIYLFLDFLMNTSPFELPFYFLRNKLRLYMEADRGIYMDNSDSIMQYKHDHLFNVVDNEIMLDVLRAIKNKIQIRVKVRSEGNDVAFSTIPAAALHDSTYGRQYVICYSEEKDSVSMVRLDRIVSLESEGKVSEKLIAKIEKAMNVTKTCWCTSIGNGEPEEVIIDFIFDEEKENYVLRRLERESHGADIKRLRNGRYRMTIMVNDPREMIPWIRSFGERAMVVSSGDSHIEDRIRDDWKKAVEKYEALS